MRKDQLGRLPAWGWMLWVAAAMAVPSVARADEAQDDALEQEVAFINALSTNGYVDFTPAVIEAAQKKWPAAKGVLEAATIRAELMGGKQEEVAKKIAARPDQNSLDTWLLKAELASSYFMYSKFTEADKIYAEFFRRFPKVPAETRKSYIEALYQYITMLGKIDRTKDALPYYKLAMEMSPNEKVQFNFRAQYLQALLAQADKIPAGAERDKILKEADDLAQKMVWRQDAFFGDAINGMAHVKMLRGDVKGAQEIIKDYLDVLMDIHKSYRAQDPDGSKGILRMSPLAQCRYLIGSMLYNEAKNEIAKPKPDEERVKNLLLGERDKETRKRNGQGALNHLVQVYMNYPESQSASLAGDMVEEITKIIKDRYNSDMKIRITPEQRAKVRQQEYIAANVKFDGGDWLPAAELFSKTISKNGLSAEALPAIRKMVECYVRSGSKGGTLDAMAKLDAETVTATLAEGFSGIDKLYTAAGDELNRIATFYGDQGLKALQEETYDLFFRYYPKHMGAVSLQLKIADEKAAAKDGDGAEKLYLQVAEAAASGGEDKRDIRTRALSELVQLYAPNGAKPSSEREVATAQEFVDHFKGIKRPGIYAALAQRALAEAYRHRAEAAKKAAGKDMTAEVEKQIRGDYARATKLYTELIAELSKANNIYVATASERKTGETLLESLYYMRGVCMQRLPSTGNAKTDNAIKARARGYFEECLKLYPKGQYAPPSLLQIGTLQAAAGDIEGSRSTLARLGKEFPKSDEAKNAIPLLADSLFKMGMMGEATNTYKQMFASGGTYTPGQYQTAAEKLLDAGEAKLAIEACDCILKAKNAGAYAPKAMLLRSRALLADGQVKEAWQQVSDFLKKYGGTQSAIEANLLLVDVAGAQILQETTPEGRNRLISDAKKAVTFVTSHEKDNAQVAARLNLAVAEVARKAYESTAKSNAEKDVVIAAVGSALNAYRTAMFTGSTPKTDPKVTEYVQAAYLGYIQLSKARADLATEAQEKQEFLRDIVDIASEYQSTFPGGLYQTDIANAAASAKIELGD